MNTKASHTKQKMTLDMRSVSITTTYMINIIFLSSQLCALLAVPP